MERIKKTGRSGNGRWSKTEHQRFLKGLQKYGRDWISVQKVIKTRDVIQIRSHAQKAFSKMSKDEIDSLVGEESQFLGLRKCEKSQIKLETKPTCSLFAYEKNQKEGICNSLYAKTNLLKIFKDALKMEEFSFLEQEEEQVTDKLSKKKIEKSEEEINDKDTNQIQEHSQNLSALA